MTDTIFALSSGAGVAGVAVFRISGDNSKKILARLTGRKEWTANVIVRADIKNPADGAPIDKAMAVFFKSPKSFTGEDCAEIFAHGGLAVIEAVYRALAATKLARLAKPGEFARRAFMNGKLSIQEAEALADLIHAETEQQRKLALSIMEKSSEELYAKWRNELVILLANAEAMIDFAEDELPKNLAVQNRKGLKKLLDRLREHIADAGAAKRIRRGIDAAICGRPNAGKSSLFNKLVGEGKALVSNISGTTRDVLEAALDIDGARVNLLDTAGIDKRAKDKLTVASMKKARETATAADIRIFMITNLGELSGLAAKGNDIILFNKIDKSRPGKLPSGVIPVSVKTGENYAKFLTELRRRVRKLSTLPRDTASARSRHIEAVSIAARELELALLAKEPAIEAEHIRLAANAIGAITGEVYLDELLDSIFGNFCLGK